ncbi:MULTISPECIES: serine/threonine-protein kinase [unclassified Streptomyces]|uniref:serine/threonine-protein kinase n=1 Tax=unclassified Streptomyces TaxID=2593676 RepID=UPI0038246691
MREGQLLGGRYLLKRFIGQGGMGEVWGAHDTTLSREVAVKLLSLDSITLRGGAATAASARRQRIDFFEREAHTMAQVDSPHVAVVHDRGREGEVLYLVMGFIDGISLAGVTGQGVQLTLEQVVRWTVQICEGLAAVHAEGVIHRDIKPANIMITKNGDAKVVDSGIARVERPFRRPAPPPAPAPVERVARRDRARSRPARAAVAGQGAGEAARECGGGGADHPAGGPARPACRRPPPVARVTSGRPHVNTDYVEDIRRNERHIRELLEREDWMSDAVLDARAHQAELTGESGDARGAAALYQSLGDDCASGLGWEHPRVKEAYVAVARWTDRIDDEPET